MHNLPWGCTWQNLKDAFAASTQNIERADVIIDSSGRSRSVQVFCHMLMMQWVAPQSCVKAIGLPRCTAQLWKTDVFIGTFIRLHAILLGSSFAQTKEIQWFVRVR